MTTQSIDKIPTDIRIRYSAVRTQSEAICEPLETEDYVIQSMTDASPMKWHLAHTTWFFETFVLREYDSGYTPFDEQYAYLFNSYYVQAGDRFARPHRGLLSRPTVDGVYDYRRFVDEAMDRFLSSDPRKEALSIIETGLNHEQQHQELMVTDLKHHLFVNPLFPVYADRSFPHSVEMDAIKWHHNDGGIVHIGHEGDSFHFDNECPPHRQFLEPFALASRPVSNREYLEFIEDGGYRNASLWLSEGFSVVERDQLSHPLYWIPENGGWSEYTLYGKRELDLHAPLTHVSYYEADAYARWAGKRIPTEFELETCLKAESVSGHFSDDMVFHNHFTEANAASEKMVHLYGSAWEWSASHYSPYPGYRPAKGALGEYNGKFMANQFVLRGGSCATPINHIRDTYRNFFPAYARWQFSTIRLAITI